MNSERIEQPLRLHAFEQFSSAHRLSTAQADTMLALALIVYEANTHVAISLFYCNA